MTSAPKPWAMIAAMRRSFSGPLAQGVLALVALVLAHHVIDLASGESRTASTAGTPDGDRYWQSIEIVVAFAAAGLVATASRQLLRLRRQAQRIRLGGIVVPESDVLHLVRLFLPTWLRLTALTTLLFLVQENVERWVVGAPLPGLNALAPSDFQLVFG